MAEHPLYRINVPALAKGSRSRTVDTSFSIHLAATSAGPFIRPFQFAEEYNCIEGEG